MKHVEIRQIFYDCISFSQIQPEFIPLDNTYGDKSWFEFWAIKNFLDNTELSDNVFYGFFSPKFTLKTGLSGVSAIRAIEDNSEKDVVLFSYAWDQLCFFLNPWEQGEVWQTGITQATQDFLNHIGLDLKLSGLVTSRNNSVFSNFVVAKKSYWEKWKTIAAQFLSYADDPDGQLFYQETQYIKGKQPMKVFIQERLPALILAEKSLSTVAIDVKTGTTAPFFIDNPENKRLLEICDLIKDEIIKSGATANLIADFKRARDNVLFQI